MKFIIAVIKPFKIADVKQALSEVGIDRMTITEVRGYGRQKGHTELYRGKEYQIDFVPKVRVEIAVDDDELDLALDTLRRAAHTDTLGDGKIFVLPLEEAIRVRTGEHGPDAL